MEWEPPEFAWGDFEHMLGANPDPMLVVRRSGHVVFANPPAIEELGLSEPRGASFVPHECGLADDTCSHISSWFEHGSLPEVQSDAETLLLTIGDELLLLCVRRSAYEQVRAEAALRERLELAVEGTDLGTWDWNVATGAVTFDERWCRMLGRELHEVRGHVDSWSALVHPQDLPWVTEVLQQHLRGETPVYETVHRMQHEDGSWIWIRDRGKVMERAPDGSPVRVAGTHLDLTVEVEARLALERERRLFVDGPVVVFRWRNEEGWPVEFVSPNCATMFGHSKEDFETGRTPFASTVHPDDVARVGAEVEAALEGELSTFEQQYRFLRADGEIRHLYDFTHVERDEAGVVTHFAGYVYDQTERVRALEAQKKLEQRIIDTQRHESMVQLAGGVAHDFNNLLVGVIGNLTLALEDIPDEHPASEVLHDALSAANESAELAQQMLAYAGQRPPKKSLVDLNEEIARSRPLLAAMVGRQVDLHFTLHPGISPVEIDPTQIRQVLLNLVANAAEAIGAKAGAIEVSTQKVRLDEERITAAAGHRQPPPGEYLLLAVSDDGEGMDDAVLRRVFDPFFSTKFTGRGLGLAGVLGIVQGHGGAIWASSRRGHGTRFEIALPLPAQATESPESPSRRRVLVVDDEEIVRRVIGRTLRRGGWEDIPVVDGEAALAFARDHAQTIDLVLLDLTMPGLDGFQTLEGLKGIDPDLPVILMSGFARDEIEARPHAVEPDAFLTKPFTPPVLLERISSVARRHSRTIFPSG